MYYLNTKRKNYDKNGILLKIKQRLCTLSQKYNTFQQISLFFKYTK